MRAGLISYGARMREGPRPCGPRRFFFSHGRLRHFQTQLLDSEGPRAAAEPQRNGAAEERTLESVLFA